MLVQGVPTVVITVFEDSDERLFKSVRVELECNFRISLQLLYQIDKIIFKLE